MPTLDNDAGIFISELGQRDSRLDRWAKRTTLPGNSSATSGVFQPISTEP